MKEDIYTSLICEKFCNYYKPGKEKEMCGGYFYLRQFITPSELDGLIKVLHIKNDEIVIKNFSFICDRCNFSADDCDFFVNKSLNPCGGYLLLSRLLNETSF